MDRADVTVVVVNFNGEPFLGECLGSLRHQTIPPGEVVLVDNASSDGSLDLVHSAFPEVRVIPREKNEFFCRGANIGLAAASASFVLLLNNDCVLDPGYIEHALSAMARDELIGSVTGKILRSDGKTIDTAGQELARSRKPLDRGWEEEDTGQFDAEEEVFGAGGVAPLLRRAMLDDVAVDGRVFDEGFVQYYEDLDLMWRARNLGWKSWYTPAAVAFHKRGATGQSQPAVQEWVRKCAFTNLPLELQGHLLKNRHAAMAKNDRPASWLAGLPWILAYEIKVLAYMLLMRPALIPRYLGGFASLRSAFRQRRELKARAMARGIRKYGGRHRIPF